MQEEVRAILRRAKEILINEGWTRREYQDVHGYCISGAIGHAFGHNDLQEGWCYRHGEEEIAGQALLALAAQLPKDFRSPADLLGAGIGVVKYNDSCQRVDEVIELIDKALEADPQPQSLPKIELLAIAGGS